MNKQEAIEILTEWKYNMADAGDDSDFINKYNALNMAIEALVLYDKHSKAVERMIERPKGEWVEVEDYNGDVHYKCDQCGEEWTFPYGTPKENNANLCPNCGADMRSTGGGKGYE